MLQPGKYLILDLLEIQLQVNKNELEKKKTEGKKVNAMSSESMLTFNNKAQATV